MEIIKIKKFTFNTFQENTFIVWDTSLECVIIDPGCSNAEENSILHDFILKEKLRPVVLFNTHCHIDHVLGNKFAADTYGLELVSHKGEEVVLSFVPQMSAAYNIHCEPSPPISKFVDEGDFIEFGNSKMKVLFTPGHSPASISLYNEDNKILIGGDVLFQGSIGRTDLPGGDYDTLINAIKTRFMVLPDDVVVYCGHGPETNIGVERKTNPFLT